MPKESFGTTQVKEIRLSRREIISIVHENIKARLSTSYDFDYDRPLVIEGDGELIFRFVQKEISREAEPRQIEMRPMPHTTAPVG